MATDPNDITTLEGFGLNVSEDLIASLPQAPSQALTFDFGGILNPPLVVQTNETECGGKLWPAGIALASYLLREKIDELTGKTMFVVRSDVPPRLPNAHCVCQPDY